MPRGPALAAFVAALLLTVPAAASAADVFYAFPSVSVTDSDGVANDLTITLVGTTVTVHDANQPVTATGPCVQVGNDATCTVAAGDGLVVALGGGDDVLREVVWPSCPASPPCAEIYGHDGADAIAGSPGGDLLYGGDGGDDIDGGAGSDTYVGGAGGDLLAEPSGSGFDAVYYSSMFGEGRAAGVTVTLDGAFNDGNGAFDVSALRAGDNVSTGIEQVVATQFADALTGGAGEDFLIGDGGNDTLNASGGADHVLGGSGDDTLNGGPGADIYNGDGGSDRINANDGNVDSQIHCFNQSGSGGPDGAADVAYTDSDDPAPLSSSCESVNPSSTTPPSETPVTSTPTTPTTTTPTSTTPTKTTTTTSPTTTQTAPTRVFRMPSLEPVEREKRKSGQTKYVYTKVKHIERELGKAGLCAGVNAKCAADDLRVELDVRGGKKISSRYRGDAPADVVWSQEPDEEKKLSADQRLVFYFVDPTLDNDKQCDITTGAQELHLKVADKTFEETEKYFKDRDCKEGRDWRVVERKTVTTLVKTSMVVGVARGERNGRKTYDLEVWDRKSVPPCTFARVDEPFILETFKGQGVKTAAAALALMASEKCDAVVVKTNTTATATDPVVSRVRKVELKSPYGDTVRFELTINQYVPVRQPGEAPQAGQPVEAKSDFCSSSVSFGPVSFEGACLKREGFTWVSTGEVKVNGLKIVPNGANAKVILDPLNLRIAATGEASVILDATIFGRRVGPVTFYQGKFDWVFQYKPDLAGIAGVMMPPAGLGGRGLSLPEIQKLPGLSGSLPDLGGLRIPDFSGLSREQLEKLATRVPKIDFPKVEIPSAVIPDFALPEIGFVVPPGLGNFLGFPLTGEVKAKFETRDGVRGAKIDVNLALPAAFKGVSGAAGFFVGSDGTLRTDAVKLAAPELWLGPIKLAPVDIGYDGPSDTWKGGTTVFLPVPKSPGIGGSFLVVGGQLKQVGVNLAGELPFGPINLNRFDGVLALDPVRVTGTLGGSVGPDIPGSGPIVKLNSNFDFSEKLFKITGDVRVANVKLGDALVEYQTSGYFHARGSLKYFLDSKNEYGFSGEIDGWATSSAFNATGKVLFKAKGRSIEGQAVVSSVGVAGCAAIKGILWVNVELGAGYKWGARSIDWIGGTCDLGPYSATRTRSSLRQSGAKVVTLPGGLDVASIAVEGSGGVPRITLTGPKGEKLVAPADGSGLQDERFFLVEQPANNTAYVAIAKPSAGDWTVTVEPGSAPIAAVLSAEALPEPAVTAKVTGRGAKRTLSYRVKPIPGQTVRFTEEGTGAAQVIGVAKGASGRLTFTPAPGGAGTRSVVAVVEQGGLARTTLPVAKYNAPSSRLAAPRVRAVRKGDSVAVTWTPVPRASGYRVTTRLNGRTVFTTVKPGARKASIDGLLPSAGATVAVQALGEANELGRSGRDRVKAPKARKRGR